MVDETQKKGLIVVAHPDDETLFFSGLVMSEADVKWTLVCVTDGNADGMGGERLQQLQKTSELLGFSRFHSLNHPDRYEQRLDQKLLQEQLQQFQSDVVYTHGILGEYGHPHHQDVSYAVHACFFDQAPVYSTAYNCYPEKVVVLERSSWEIKSNLISTVYFQETKRFIEFIPATGVESFSRVGWQEVEHIYRALCDQKPVRKEMLRVYSWHEPYLNDFERRSKERPF